MDKNKPEERKESTLGDAMQRQIEEHIRQYTSKSELHRVETQKGTDGNEIERLREAFDMVKANRPLPHFPSTVNLGDSKEFNPEIDKYSDTSIKEPNKNPDEQNAQGTTGIQSGTQSRLQRLGPAQEQQMSFDFGEGQHS